MANEDLVLFEKRGRVAVITINRPDARNAQNGKLIYQLDDAYYRFAQDDDLAVAVLRGEGKSFSAGHDIGKGSDRGVSFPRRSLWWDHSDKQGVDNRFAREQELYLGLTRRWRELPKPTIAMVHGACIAGGLMLAWSCDFVVASPDAFFSDPVVAVGLPGMEYFIHPHIMGSRRAKEFLFTGRRVYADEAKEFGMVNHVYPLDELEERTMELAETIARMPRLGLALAKQAVNRFEDAMGLDIAIDSVFGLHQLGHSHNAETQGNPIHGLNTNAILDVMNGADSSRREQ